MGIPRHRVQALIHLANKAPNKVSRREWIPAAFSSDCDCASESNLQERKRFEIRFLPVFIRAVNVWMAPKPAEELIKFKRPQEPKKTRQAQRLSIHQTNHVNRWRVITPQQRTIGSRSPLETLSADNKLSPAAQIYAGI